MNFESVFTLVILLILVIVYPVLGVRDHRIFQRECSNGVPEARVKYFKGIIYSHWPLTLGLLTWWLFAGKSLDTLGLVPATGERELIVAGVGVLVILVQLISSAVVFHDKKKLLAVRNQTGELTNIAPQTNLEQRWFDLLSVTAGVCEEILYRGFLLVMLASLIGVWPAVIVSSLIFGLVHAYQGIRGIGKTSLVGLGMALFTVYSGSLFIAIVLHTVIDLTSGRIIKRASREVSTQTA